MYREYRDMPVVNRTCMKATQDRAYQKHLEALQKTKATINTKSPPVPRTVGLNLKRYENEKQRNEEIVKQNMKLRNDLEKIHNRKPSPNKSPQTHFTLRGAYHVDQAEQIDRENRKLVNALVNQKPNIKRTDFYYHNCDHIYQVNKMSIHKKTVPMSQIMRTKLPPMEDVSVPKSTRSRAPRKIPELESNKAPSTSRDNLFVTNKGNSNQLKVTTDNENQIDDKARADEIKNENSGLLGQEEEEEYADQFHELVNSDSESSKNKDEEKGILDQIADQTADALAGQKDEEKSESDGILDKIADQATDLFVGQKDEEKNESDGKLDQIADNNFDALMGKKSDQDDENQNYKSDDNDEILGSDDENQDKMSDDDEENQDKMSDDDDENQDKMSDDDENQDKMSDDDENQDKMSDGDDDDENHDEILDDDEDLDNDED